MADSLKLGARDRVDYSEIHTAIQIPNLIEVQKRSYERFLQMHAAPADRDAAGLQGVFKSVFPIRDFRETCSLFLSRTGGSPGSEYKSGMRARFSTAHFFPL